MEGFRNRVKEMRMVDSRELTGHSDNFRLHPQAQKNAFRAVLKEIGQAGALVAYYSDRNEGRLTIIDGHMRADEGGTWPVLITDLDDREADLLLQAFDPVGAMAIADKEVLNRLRERAQFEDKSIAVMLDSLQGVEAPSPEEIESHAAGQTEDPEDRTIPEMELQPYEHYDYVLVVARNVYDWNWICDRLDIQKVNGTNDYRHPKVGLGRAIPADKLIALLEKGEKAIARLEALQHGAK